MQLSQFQTWEKLDERLYKIPSNKPRKSQRKTNEAFSEKWTNYSNEELAEQETLFQYQKDWFLKLYGFENEKKLKEFCKNTKVIFDMGCGLGYKSAWLAALAPKSTIIGIDYSNSIFTAYERYKNSFPNLYFAQGNIANTQLHANISDLTICDQVIMHTDDPQETLKELARITSDMGTICCHWYKKKSLPREHLDEYFRNNVTKLNNEELWQLSEDVLKLGKTLSDLNITTNFPSIPALGIQGGEMDLQRFIYWNFIKCFWNEELGYSTSLTTNFDWYSPVNAKRFSKEEVLLDLGRANLTTNFFHEEEACYSGRFSKSV